MVSSHEIVFVEFFSIALAYTSHMYSEVLAYRPSVKYIPYTTSSHKQTGDIITFEQFEEGDLFENGLNVAEYESILASIDESSTYNDSDNVYIITNALEDIRYVN